MTAAAAPVDRAAPVARRPRGQTTSAVAALLVLVVANALFTPNFATAGNLWNVLLQMSTVTLVAVGMTFVIATGGIDLSVGLGDGDRRRARRHAARGRAAGCSSPSSWDSSARSSSAR